jgi:two-component system chemotaxis response regulator CheY
LAPIGPRLKTFKATIVQGRSTTTARAVSMEADDVPGRRWKGLPRDNIRRGHCEHMSKTVLHADDSASVRRWVAEQLGDMDLKVISVADGEAALKVLQEAPCDLLLTDLEMPNLDGLSLVSKVRDLPMHRFLPVLILSCRKPTEFQPENRQGVTGWLIKGIEPDELRRWVRRVLPR